MRGYFGGGARGENLAWQDTVGCWVVVSSVARSVALPACTCLSLSLVRSTVVRCCGNVLLLESVSFLECSLWPINVSVCRKEDLLSTTDY